MNFAHLSPGRRVAALLAQAAWYLRARRTGFDDIETGRDPDDPLPGDSLTSQRVELRIAARASREEYHRLAGAAGWNVLGQHRGRAGRSQLRPHEWLRDRDIARAIADGKPRSAIMREFRIGRPRYDCIRRELNAKIREEIANGED